MAKEKEIPKRLELLLGYAQENIRLIKKQEWVYTSSVLAVYAGLIAGSRQTVMSALPPKADMCSAVADVR